MRKKFKTFLLSSDQFIWNDNKSIDFLELESYACILESLQSHAYHSCYYESISIFHTSPLFMFTVWL